MPNDPKHNDLIVELIHERAKLKVTHDVVRPTFHPEHRLWLPTTQIHVFQERPGRYQLAKMQPDGCDYPRVRVRVKAIRWHEFWISAHRISYVASCGPTDLEVDHMDRNRTNYNYWNLRCVTRHENMANQGRFFVGYDDHYLRFLAETHEELMANRRRQNLPELDLFHPGPLPDDEIEF